MAKSGGKFSHRNTGQLNNAETIKLEKHVWLGWAELSCCLVWSVWLDLTCRKLECDMADGFISPLLLQKTEGKSKTRQNKAAKRRDKCWKKIDRETTDAAALLDSDVIWEIKWQRISILCTYLLKYLRPILGPSLLLTAWLLSSCPHELQDVYRAGDLYINVP